MYGVHERGTKEWNAGKKIPRRCERSHLAGSEVNNFVNEGEGPVPQQSAADKTYAAHRPGRSRCRGAPIKRDSAQTVGQEKIQPVDNRPPLGYGTRKAM